MSRMVEDYICASEDRIHYDTEDYYPFGYYLRPKKKECVAKNHHHRYDNDLPSGYYIDPAVAPIETTTINIITTNEVTNEQIREVVDEALPNIREDITNDVLDIIDDGIDEIYGGSASDVIKELDTP